MFSKGELSDHEIAGGKPHSHDQIQSIRRWLFYIAVEAGFSSVFIVLSGGAFLTGLALMLGANDFEIGFLAAIPFLAQVAQLFSVFLVNRVAARKLTTSIGFLIGRQIWWIMILVLFLPISRRLEVLLAIVIVSSLTTMLAAPAWLSWMAELVPERVRGRYFARRSIAVAVATVTATIGGGFILDHFRILNNDTIGFAIIIAIGGIFALAASWMLNKLPDKPRQSSPANPGLANLLEPLQNRSFRHLLLGFFFWNLAIGISAPFFVPHMLGNLSMNFTMIALYSSAAALVAVALNKPWGTVIDKFGCKPVIALCAFGIALIPLIWLLPRKGFLWILVFESIFSGALWTGFNLAAFNIPIANSPRDKRTIYLAMFAVITGLGFFIASIIGGILAKQWVFLHWQIGKQVIINYHVIFIISSFLRFMAAGLLSTFHEPAEKGLPIMLNFMGYSVLKKLSVGRQIHPWFRRNIIGQ
jgi:MFS family permease